MEICHHKNFYVVFKYAISKNMISQFAIKYKNNNFMSFPNM